MDKRKIIVLIDNNIQVPEDLKLFLKDYLAEFAVSEDYAIETNSVSVLAYTEKIHGNPAKVRLISDLRAALHYYFGYETGCELLVLSENPIEDMVYPAQGLRPYLTDFPYAEPVTEFPARDVKNSKVSLKVYSVDEHKNPNLRYFKK